MCACGHFCYATLIATVPGFLFGLTIFLLSEKTLKASSIITLAWLCSFAGLCLLTWLFVASVSDVLWHRSRCPTPFLAAHRMNTPLNQS